MELRLLVVTLAVFRLSVLFAYDKMFEWFRHRVLKAHYLGEDGQPKFWTARFFTCPWCTGLLFGGVLGPLMFTPYWTWLVPLAVAGGALFLLHSSNLLRYVER